MSKKPRTFEGNLVGTGLKFAVLVSRFNEFITGRLLSGAMDAFTRHGVAEADVDVVWVPGAFEMPLVARRLANTKRYNGVCCIGAVVRGGTPHFDHVATQVSRGIAQAAWDSDVPMSFGVLTCDTIEQAIERAGSKAGNKGFDAAVSAIETARLFESIEA